MNPHVETLSNALIGNVLPTADEIRGCMEMAYKLGHNDGSLETANRLLNSYRPKDSGGNGVQSDSKPAPADGDGGQGWRP